MAAIARDTSAVCKFSGLVTECDGWTLDTVQFAMRESSRRPSMAFVMFTRPLADPSG